MSKYRMYIKIHNFNVSPHEITDLLSLQPDQCWSKGDEIPGRKIKLLRKQSSWIYKIDVDESIEDMELHLKEAMEIVSTRVPEFRQIGSNGWSMELTVVIYNDNANTGFTFRPEYLLPIISLGFTLDVDIYFMGSKPG